MSLSKEKSIEVNYRRDSFSDRVSDNLCQFILQYLSLESRLRLECVSKQFQRTALVSHSSIDLDLITKSRKQLKQLLKKLQNLKQISLDKMSNKLFELIIKNCNILTHIHFEFEVLIDNESIKMFFDKFGHQLISLHIERQIQKYCHSFH